MPVRPTEGESVVAFDALAERASTLGWSERQAADADAEGLVALIAGVFAEYPGCVLDPEGLDADLFAWASHLRAAGGIGWVVLDEAGIVRACVGAAPATGAVPGMEPGATVVELKRLYVHPTARRHGLGSALVARVQSWADALGADAVVLWSDTRFHDAHRLYGRLGFRPTGRDRELHDPSDTTEDEYVRSA